VPERNSGEKNRDLRKGDQRTTVARGGRISGMTGIELTSKNYRRRILSKTEHIGLIGKELIKGGLQDLHHMKVGLAKAGKVLLRW